MGLVVLQNLSICLEEGREDGGRGDGGGEMDALWSGRVFRTVGSTWSS